MSSSSKQEFTGIMKSQSTFISNVDMSKLTSDPKEAEWLNGLRDFLYNNVLSVVEPDHTARLQYVTVTAMEVWMASFTHSSYDPNEGKNYEVAEKLGDAVMKLAFTWYLMKKFPSIRENHLSRFTDEYLAKSFQADIAVSLNLNKYIRTLIDISRHTNEDALESLFGGLFVISEALIPKVGKNRKVSLAYDNCSRLVDFIFNQVTFDPKVLAGSAINQVKEIFDKLRWKASTNLGEEIERKRQLEDGRFIVELHFNEPFYQWVDEQNLILGKQGKPLMKFNRRATVFGRGIDYSTKEARRRAYKNALDILKQYGITWTWADKMRTLYPGWDNSLVKLFNEATSKAQRENYAKIEFSKLRKGTAAYYLQLYGIYKNGSIDVLGTIDGSAELPSATKAKAKITDDDMRKAVLLLYIKHGKHPQAVTYRTIIS